MTRTWRGITATGVALAITTIGIVTAGAQSTTTTRPGTTSTTSAASTSSYPVLQAVDLPAGYALTTGSPQKRAVSPLFPTVDDCVLTTTNRFSGLTPTSYTGAYEKNKTDAFFAAEETVWVFTDANAAKAFYEKIDLGYRAATKCKKVKEMQSAATVGGTSSSDLVNLGSLELVNIGKVGDDSLSVSLDFAGRAPTARYAFILDGSSVASLRVNDTKLSAAKFKALAKAAAARL